MDIRPWHFPMASSSEAAGAGASPSPASASAVYRCGHCSGLLHLAIAITVTAIDPPADPADGGRDEAIAAVAEVVEASVEEDVSMGAEDSARAMVAAGGLHGSTSSAVSSPGAASMSLALGPRPPSTPPPARCYGPRPPSTPPPARLLRAAVYRRDRSAPEPKKRSRF